MKQKLWGVLETNGNGDYLLVVCAEVYLGKHL